MKCDRKGMALLLGITLHMVMASHTSADAYGLSRPHPANVLSVFNTGDASLGLFTFSAASPAATKTAPNPIQKTASCAGNFPPLTTCEHSAPIPGVSVKIRDANYTTAIHLTQSHVLPAPPPLDSPASLRAQEPNVLILLGCCLLLAGVRAVRRGESQLTARVHVRSYINAPHR